MINSKTIQLYESEFSGLLKPFVEKALRIYNRIEPAAKLSNPETLTKIREIASELYSQGRSGKKEDLFIEVSPEGFITSSEELKIIRPELEKLRLEVFGKTKPPFKDLDQALCWIGKEAGKEIEGKKLSKLKQLSIFGKYFIFAPDTPLDVLAKNTDFWSQRTRFRRDSLIIYILTGIKPIARVYTIQYEGKLSRPKKGQKPIPITPKNITSLFPLSFIDLRIYQALTEREFSSLFKKIRQVTKPPRKRLNEKHLRLYEFFEKHGPPPAKGKMKFWEEKYSEWKKQYPDDEIKSSRALMMACRRLNQFLKKY